MFAASLALVVAASPGCARGDGDAGGKVVVDTIAGVVHVRHGADATRWRAREVASIGSAEGPASFGRIVSLVADAEGNVYVADGQASEIRVFGSDGAHRRTFGRKGQGPGEFMSLYSLAWIGDSLAVLDPRSARISLLARSGEWLGQIPHAPITGPDIRLHSVGADVYSFDVTGTPDGKSRRTWLRYRPGAIDTMPYPTQPPGSVASTILCPHPAGGGFSFFTNPFVAQPFQSPAPGKRVALVNGADYRIHLLGETGDTALVIEKQQAPVPITDAEWDEATQSHRDWAAKNPGAKCDPVEFTRPSAKPAIRGIFFDDAGRLWVEAVTGTGHGFDLFDSRGVHLASIPSPARQRSVPPYVRGDRMYLVATDSLDVQSVKVFAIER